MKRAKVNFAFFFLELYFIEILKEITWQRNSGAEDSQNP